MDVMAASTFPEFLIGWTNKVCTNRTCYKGTMQLDQCSRLMQHLPKKDWYQWSETRNVAHSAFIAAHEGKRRDINLLVMLVWSDRACSQLGQKLLQSHLCPQWHDACMQRGTKCPPALLCGDSWCEQWCGQGGQAFDLFPKHFQGHIWWWQGNGQRKGKGNRVQLKGLTSWLSG